MEFVDNQEGVTIAYVTPEKLTTNIQAVGFALLLCLIHLGGFVLIINAYLHFTKRYMMCFDIMGNWDKTVIKQLTKEELENEFNNGLIYTCFYIAFRLIPILFLLWRFETIQSHLPI